MNLHYTLTAEDMVAFNQYCFKHTTAGKKIYALMRFAPSLSVIVLAVSRLYTPTPDALPQFVFFVLFAGAYILLYPKFNRAMLKRAFQKQLQGHESDDHLFQLDTQGISMTSPKGNTALYWSAIKEIVTTDQHIFFFYNPRCAAILAKRAFATMEECTSFLQLAQHYQRSQTTTS